jgi:hypothetical protein
VLQTLPSGKLDKALAYLLNQWPKLVRYTEDGKVAINTNLAEIAIRSFALGRRNWLFADTVSGAKASGPSLQFGADRPRQRSRTVSRPASLVRRAF